MLSNFKDINDTWATFSAEFLALKENSHELYTALNDILVHAEKRGEEVILTKKDVNVIFECLKNFRLQ